jgi:hypothetical protein
MLKNFAVAITCATLSLTVLAANDIEKSTGQVTASKIQLAQGGATWCKKGFRYDRRSHSCVPA